MPIKKDPDHPLSSLDARGGMSKRQWKLRDRRGFLADLAETRKSGRAALLDATGEGADGVDPGDVIDDDPEAADLDKKVWNAVQTSLRRLHYQGIVVGNELDKYPWLFDATTLEVLLRAISKQLLRGARAATFPIGKDFLDELGKKQDFAKFCKDTTDKTMGELIGLIIARTWW
jgi:hypothetical protein